MKYLKESSALITVRLDKDLRDKVDKMKDRLFGGNRTAVITKALEEYVGENERIDAEYSQRLKKAIFITDYIKTILSNEKIERELLIREVDELCLTLGKDMEFYE